MTSSHKRRTQTRAYAGISAQIIGPDGRRTSTERIANISLGGLFVEMDEPLPFGADVSIEFTLPVTPGLIRCKGFVVWSSKEQDTSSGRPPGIGVRLIDIGMREMRLVADYVEGRL
ncbi:MAG: PilZ domain-containing protein [Myxococcota bacterium]